MRVRRCAWRSRGLDIVANAIEMPLFMDVGIDYRHILR
jgi:hypothetical protein